MRILSALIVIFLWSIALTGQVVDKSGLVKAELENGTQVWVMPGYDQHGIHTYYYLPARLRLSRKADNTPEFSFITYRAEEGKEISGAIFNFLLVWGLNPEEEEMLGKFLQSSIDSNAILAGVVSLELPETQASVQVIGKSTIAEILRTKWNSSPVAPVLPGTKMAFSYRLSGEEAKAFETAFSSPAQLDDICIELKFGFRGAYRDLWYNRFKEDHYTMKASVRELFSPVLPLKKQTQ